MYKSTSSRVRISFCVIMSYGKDDNLLIGTMKHCSFSISHFHYGAAPCPFSIAPCPFSETTFCAFFFFFFFFFGKKFVKIGQILRKLQDSAEMTLAKFMIKLIALIPCLLSLNCSGKR